MARTHTEARTTLKRWAVLAGLLLLITGAYVFFVSAGRIVNWPIQTWFLERSRPRDFGAAICTWRWNRRPSCCDSRTRSTGVHRPLWYWDASLYKGHYYLYWGPSRPRCC